MKFSRSPLTLGLLLLVLGFQLGVKTASANAESIAPSNSIVPGEQDSAGNICPSQLPEAIDAIANRPEYRRFRWGILIQTLSPSIALYSRDAQQYFIPASNVKLLTTAAALLRLGSDFRIRTSVYGRDGVLRLVGRGDPSLTDAQLRDLAQQLRRRGIRQIQQLIVQDGYFQGSALHPTWEWEDVYADYGQSVNSLILNQNIVQLKLLPQQVGQPLQITWDDPFAALQWQVENQSVTATNGVKNSVQVSGVLGKPILQIRGELAIDSQPETLALPVRDPAEHFLRHFRLALILEGITVAEARVVSGGESGDEPELAFVESPPVSQIIADINQPSNNLYAEAILRTLGAAKKDSEPKSNDTAEMGLNAVRATLSDLGVDPKSYVLEDGSGLSRHNLVSPEAFVQTLRAIALLPQAEIYRVSLPVAGISGTLRNRFKDTPSQGIVYAKSGTMTGVVSLSGYVNPPNYERLVFSIIVNQSDRPASVMRGAIDEVVLLLTRLRRC